MHRNVYIGATFVVALAALGIGSSVISKRLAVRAAGAVAPRFEVDPMWPKPLPNHWIMGNVIGVSVDSKDHIWLIHRQGSIERMEAYAQASPVASECCIAAPPVLEFDQEGNLLAHWGGSDGDGYVWPDSNHGIFVDYKGNVWIGGNGRGTPPGGRGRGGAVQAPADETASAAGRGPAGIYYHDSMVMKFTQEGKFL